jgi:subtilisin family serine protease
MKKLTHALIATAALLLPISFQPNVVAQETPLTRTAQASSPVFRSWMSPEVAHAWNKGYTGVGTTMTFVDDFNSSSRFYGNLGSGTQLLRHGEWTRLEGSMVAPGASIASRDFNTRTTVPLGAGLNVINMSYGMYAASKYSLNQIGWSAQESSLISYAGGRAIIVKAAGNDSINIGGVNSKGQRDYLNLSLVGKPTAIFVGALNRNGTSSAPASLASYSNTPGANTTIQNQFVVVGVETNKTGLAGTSFAAPVIAGYSAIIGNKFRNATPTQITNQLLTTARKDTLTNFNAATYGRGEASLTRALAPVSIR